MSKFLRPVRDEDLAWVSRNMRDADAQECKAAAGMAPELALLLSTKVATECHTMVSPSGEAVGICGLGPGLTDNDRQVWMLCTNDLLKHKRLFLEESRAWIEEKSKRYLLWNHVDARNTVHVRWLKWLGANFHGSHTSPYTGTPLLHFTKVTLCA